MKGKHPESTKLIIIEAYQKYRMPIYHYISRRLKCKIDAEDLTQDAFLRLITHEQKIQEKTVHHLLFTVTKNLVTDYLRRNYKRQEICATLTKEIPTTESDAGNDIIAKDIQRLELFRVNKLPPRCKIIYYKSRFEEMSAIEIAQEMNISRRTVEGHIMLGRKQVRQYISRHI